MIFTGKGKGKTSAALGIVLRSVGHGQRVAMIQFIKGRMVLRGANKLKKARTRI